ncbi:MAG: P-loop containing nucleoside triphosphate hydrolase protein, partial [Piptocephalis tieghemiana]
LQADQAALTSKLDLSQSTLQDRERQIQDLQSDLAHHRSIIQDMEGKVQKEEILRRRLHNTIQELKGNIRVFCRVRPLLEHEHEELNHIRFGTDLEQATIELTQATASGVSGKAGTKTYPFTFDRVFPPTSRQGEVFEEISQLVQSALDGYPVCIFAYGQTGSGKTYTMEGPGDPNQRMVHPEHMGMIPRTARQIFEAAEALREKGWVYRMEGQFVEIYNEVVYDLLGDPKPTSVTSAPVSSLRGPNIGAGRGSEGGKRCEIKHNDRTKTTIITDAATVLVDSPEKVTELLQRAAANRAVASTQCNDRSSRSHSVFILRLHGTHETSGETCDGVLNLIDLAGSERLSVSGSTGDRLRETQAINKSLSSLGDVIQALANKEPHIPFRHSRLTFLLQNSLGGNSKTLMFVNVNPQMASFNETLCSLRFAAKVNSCQIGTAKRQVRNVS